MSIINEALKKAAQDRGKEEEWLPKEFKPTPVKKIDFLAVRQDTEVKEILEKNKQVSSKPKKSFIFLTAALSGSLVLTLGAGAYWFILKKNTKEAGLQSPRIAEKNTPSNAKDFHTLSNLSKNASPNKVSPPPVILETRSENALASENIPRLELTGIMMEDRPQALVNGVFVKQGDEVNGVKILEIYSDHVVFQFGDKKFKKSLY